METLIKMSQTITPCTQIEIAQHYFKSCLIAQAAAFESAENTYDNLW